MEIEPKQITDSEVSGLNHDAVLDAFTKRAPTSQIRALLAWRRNTSPGEQP